MIKSKALVRSSMVLVAFVLLVGTSFAQQLTINASFAGNPQVVFISEMMVLAENAESQRPLSRPLFTVSITNPTATPKSVYLRMRFSYNGRELGGVGRSSNFTVPSGTTVLDANRFSSAPYKLRGFKFGQSDFQSLSGSGSSTNFPTTILPAGSYVLLWTLVDASTNTDIQETQAAMTLTNPTGFVQLIGPGVPVGTSKARNAENTIQKGRNVFNWTSDATGGFRIKIWEDPRGTGNFTDVINTNPIVDTKTSNPTYDYTGSGGRELQEGKMYFWQVTAEVVSLTQSYTVSSTPNFFYVGSMSGNETATGIDELKRLLKDKYSVSAPWLDESSFVSFSGMVDGAGILNSNDLNFLINILKR
ncbi:MAG: hypothetical protein SFU91_12515 [Chloroherpetonaceae bacterium]|nr:hypothetical protein [Chloroherpetonaceae bacterium]